METITDIIKNATFKKNDSDWITYEGYLIVTNKQHIKIGISNEQCCCEDWGHFVSEDDLEDFIGAQIIDISLTDTSLNTEILDKENLYLDEGDIMFLNVATTNGMLQFAAYNSHNGYYGHNATIISEQLKHDCYL